MFNIFQLNVKCYLNNNIEEKDVLNQIRFCIDLTLGKNKEYLEFHKKKCFKNYCFNGFYPLENDKVYKEDNIYTFQIRTVDKNLAMYLSEELPKVFSDCIKVLRVEVKIISKKHLNKIYSLTPCLIKSEFGYWKDNITIDEYAEKLKINLIKKYNYFMNEKIDEEFPLFTSIEFKNKKPINIKYKSINLLGDKISLNIADDELSQKIAWFAIGGGILENNSSGLGFMNFRYL